MQVIEVEQQDDVSLIRLARPPANALNPALVQALIAAIADAPASGARGIALSGAPGLFSAGLDLPELLTLDRDAITVFWSDFVGLMRAMADSPIPVAAAITGHSPAGGAVLALCCDYRVMAEGSFRIGLNEVRVGLPLPVILYDALTHVVGPRRAALLGVEGRLLDPAQALATGFVDELAPPEAVEAKALGWLNGVLTLPPAAYSATRAHARASLREAFADAAAAPAIRAIADSWFSEETQASLKRVVAELRVKKKS
ncbi:MAG TPA: enoyl-CoA hydratase/isomerase family protein [Gammaproteobacteria bacterium]|nr:enoyl-CoA hydratase/isomerase family protein [Gammaproteobacteria bacterium]